MTVADHTTQRRRAPVDHCADAAIADIGVHGIRKIHDGCTARQTQDLSFWREDIDFVGEQVDFDALEELLAAAALLHFHQARQPFTRAVMFVIRFRAAFVFPVRRDAGLGDAMHIFGTDLHFNRRSTRTEQSRVQRLITIDARNRHVILESSRHRPVDAVHDAERPIAHIRRFDNHAQTENVDDFRKRHALAAHFSVDAEQMLFTREHACRNVGFGERRAQILGDFIEKLFLIAARALDGALKHLVTLRIGGAKAQVLEFQF